MAGVIKLLILGHKTAFKTDFMVKNDSEQDIEITSALYSPPQMFVFHICGYFTLLCTVSFTWHLILSAILVL